jgi:hypothetical protein
MLLMQPVYERRTLGSLWMTWSLLAAALLALLVVGAWHRHWGLGAVMAAVLLGAAALMWWAMLVKSAVAQNQPSHACLVPGLRRGLRRMLVAVFCPAVLLVAGLASMEFHHFGYLLAIMSLMFPVSLLTARYAVMGFLPSIVIFSGVTWGKGPIAAAARWLAGYDETAVTLAALAVIALLGAWALQEALPAGGDAHSDWHRKYINKLAALKRGVAISGGPATLADTAKPKPWSRWLHRPLSAGTPTGARLMAGLGLSVWAAAVSAPLIAALSWLVVALLQRIGDMKGPSLGTGMVEAFAMLSVPVCMQMMTAALAQRTGEQALLRLAPGISAAPALNRALARVMLQRFVAVYAGSVLCVLSIEAMATGRPALSGYGLLMVALPLPFSLGVLRDYAAMRRQRDPLQLGIVLGMLAFMAPMELQRVLPDFWCGMLALAIAAISLAALCWRWLRMMRAPVAFPACRLAP